MQVVFVGRHRRVWPRLLLYLATLGVSRRVWLFRINKEVDGHEAIGINTHLMAVLLWMPIVGPTVVTAQAARRVRRMLEGSGIRYGPSWPVYLATWVPILGNLFFIGWTQGRLNRFWTHERQHPEHGVELDLDLSEDPRFVVELQQAVRESHQAGSRFERRRRRRRERWTVRRGMWQALQEERRRVRAAGGSTPLLPWRRPPRPALRVLHVTCTRCSARFHVEREMYGDTLLHCPRCGLHEVLPGASADPLAPKEPVAYPLVKAECPKCATRFETPRSLRGPTRLQCPDCGHADTLDAPDAVPAEAREPTGT